MLELFGGRLSVKSVSVKSVLAHAAARRWSDVLAETADGATLAARPALVAVRIEAALEIGDEAELERTLAAAECLPLRPELRYAAIRPLLKFARPAEAWRVLTTQPAVTAHHRYGQQARKVLAYARHDVALARTIRTALRQLEGPAVKPLPSSFAFRPRANVAERALGRVSISASSEVDPKHVAGLSLARDRFRRRLTKPAAPAVHEYRDVFVDPTGQIWAENGSIITTMGRPIPQVDRDACPQFEVAIPALRGTRGIYHWLVDILPHLALLDAGQRLPVLLGARGPAFERESLELAGFAPDDLALMAGPVFVKRLVVPTVGLAGLRHWRSTGDLFERIAAQASQRAAATGLACPESIYISRRDSSRRPLVNEVELEAALAAHGYGVVLMSGVPLWQQVALAVGVRRIVAPHGAGLSHLMFCRENTRITELLPIMDGSYALRFNYARLALALGFEYHAWLEPQLPRTDRWSLRLDEFSEALL